MDGLEVCKQIKRMKHMATVPIIFFSAKNSVEDKVEGLREGVADYITKPVDDAELLARIASALKVSDRYKEISFLDEPTGLHNRNYFNEQFEHFFQIARRYGRIFSLIVLDIDDFKGINDRCGHLCGDTVLEGVGKLLKNCLRNVDTISRYGGDEFVVILPETNTAQVSATIDRLSKTLQGFKVEYKGRSIPVGVSIGSATYSDSIKKKEDIFDIADKNMYAKKNVAR